MARLDANPNARCCHLGRHFLDLFAQFLPQDYQFLDSRKSRVWVPKLNLLYLYIKKA